MQSPFDRVRRAISQAPERILPTLGIKFKASIRGEWTAVVCPLCDDKSASASITKEGFLKCHQCACKEDVFAWTRQKRGFQSDWIACKALAKELGIELPTTQDATKKTRGGTPPRMTKEVLASSIVALWEDPTANLVREFLAERKLGANQPLTAALGIGFIRGYLTFAQRDERGQIEERYRGYMIGSPLKWRWMGQGTGGVGFWLRHRVKAEGPIMLLEGEWDVWTALERLRLEDQGWSVVTWTSGATGCPAPAEIPESWRGREVHVCYDNDTFQSTPYDEWWAPTEKARKEMVARRKAVLTRLAPTLQGAGCEVFLRAVPIRPQVTWGADLRDWVDQGGQDLNDLPSFRFSEMPSLEEAEDEVRFDEVFDRPDRRVRFASQVDLVRGDDVMVPTTLQMHCQLGGLKACEACLGLRRFPDGVIHLEDRQRELMVSLCEKAPLMHLVKLLIEPPRGCPKVELVPIASKVSSEWFGGRAGVSDDTRQRKIHVFSAEAPSLSGEIEVSGTVYQASTQMVVAARRVRSIDHMEVDLEGFEVAFSDLPRTRTLDEIDTYLHHRARDLAANVTRIYGRPDIHIAHDLLAHSVIEMPVDGMAARGWVDCSVIGDTRSGKSVTFRRMFAHHGLGNVHATMDNISRAGLTMGADRQMLLKPGLFPKTHRKMLVLDEFHFMVQSAKAGEHPMSWLQSARDDGRVHGVKVYGDRILPASVRLGTIANWARNSRRAFEHPCEHFLYLYGAPESLSRLDFGLVVEGAPEESMEGVGRVEHWWTAERVRTLILRAWSMTPRDVIFEDGVVELARDFAKTWKHIFESVQLPLFTPEEKPYSILRLAIAVANVCFSRTERDFSKVVVAQRHVEWAAEWLRRVWTQSGYERYSAAMRIRERIESPFEAERQLTFRLELADPAHAELTLATLKSPFTLQELCATIGKETAEATKWIARAKALRIFHSKRAQNAYNVEFWATAGGDALLTSLIELAQDHPEEYVARYKRLEFWTKGGAGPDGLDPMVEVS